MMPELKSDFDTVFENIVDNISKICGLDLAEKLKNSKNRIFQKYEDAYKQVETKYMSANSRLLDRHKHGALFMIAFIKGLRIEEDVSQLIGVL